MCSRSACCGCGVLQSVQCELLYKEVDTSRTWSTSKRAKVGRPKHKERIDAFLEVAEFLEQNDDEQITINDL